MEMLNLLPKKRRKLNKLIRAPLKLLVKARDLYIAGMGGHSDRVGIASVIGCPTAPIVNTLPKSYSLNSTKSSNYREDYGELLRTSSSKSTYGNGMILDRSLQRQTSTKNKQMPRSLSVGIGRIDEDNSCRFDGNVINLETNVVFTKSRSYVVGNTRIANKVF